MALCDQPEVFASDLCDNQSRYLYENCDAVRVTVAV